MTRSAIVGTLLVAWSATGATALERQVGGVGLTIFSDMNFRGDVVTLRDDNPNLHTVGLFRLASSLRVGPGEQWEICDDVDYRGACLVISGSESDLRRLRWNDRVASARRVRTGRGGGRGIVPPIQPPVTEAGIELYSGPRFYGDRQQFTAAVSNLDGLFNDRAMSLRVAPNEIWEVCEHANYRNCRTVSSTVMDLGEIGLARSISSLRPIRTGRGGRGAAPRLVLFDNRAFGGASRTIERDAPVLLGVSNRADSVQVSGGTWEICDRPRFEGRCITITASVPDLARVGFANQIQSVRPR